MAEAADIGPSHTERQTRPAMLGVSGGNMNDRVLNMAGGGTLGALVHDSKGRLYILGNSHILGCLNKAKAGQVIIQPSLVDQGTSISQSAKDEVGRLTKYISIKFSKGKSTPANTVDAAIAAVSAGKVRTDGYIMDIGVPGTKTLKAKVGRPVKKSGRTSGLTQSIIAATNVTVDVTLYNNTSSRFKNQILIYSSGSAEAGDGGALVVDDTFNSPRPIGLLFGGNSSYALASPIDEVFKQLGVSMGGVLAKRVVARDKLADVEAPEAIALDKAMEAAGAVKARFDDKLMAIDNVVGNGVSFDWNGNPVIEVYLKRDRALTRSKIPGSLGKIPTRVVVTGEFAGM
jgi:hypothetical protein